LQAEFLGGVAAIKLTSAGFLGMTQKNFRIFNAEGVPLQSPG
jgi:hypothetical protein